jgi:hypothetical protein
MASSVLNSAGPWLLAVAVFGFFLIYYGYFALFESIWNGQTPGKRAIGLRVIHASGRPVSVFEAILRNIVRVADQLPGIYAIGIVCVFVTRRSQRLGDLAAGTVVVHERAPEPADFARDAPAAPPPSRHGAEKLTADEMAVIDLFFRRREQLAVFDRERAARKIAARMRERLEISVRIGDEQLLEEISAEYQARGRYR